MTARSWWDAVCGVSRDVLGLNRRNLEYVYPLNPRWAYVLADDKRRAKAELTAHGLPTAPTLACFDRFEQLARLDDTLRAHDEFVVKPAHGRAGRGVLVIVSRAGDGFVTAGGRRLSLDHLRRHIADIVFGVFSLDRADAALVEPRLVPSGFFAALAPAGLADIRIITVDGVPKAAMIRAPTVASDGRANIHQGAVGIAVDLATGALRGGWHRRSRVAEHPDTGHPLSGIGIPGWAGIVDIARRVSAVLPLRYLGLDIIVDAARGPLILEFNARPGLEIQNVLGVPLGRALGPVGPGRAGARA